MRKNEGMRRTKREWATGWQGIFGAAENSIKCHTSIKQSSCQWTEHHQSRAGWVTPFLTPDTEIKGKVHSEMKSVIIYTLSCHSKPMWLSFFSGKQPLCLPSTLRCSCPYRTQWPGKKVEQSINEKQISSRSVFIRIKISIPPYLLVFCNSHTYKYGVKKKHFQQLKNSWNKI